MADCRRFYEAAGAGARRSAPAALRNRQAIAQVLENWLPPVGTVLEIASGTGEHVSYFAERFAALEWQPSDIHPDAMASIWTAVREVRLPNLRDPLLIDAEDDSWADRVRLPATAVSGGGYSAILCINMVHISPWSAALGLLDGSARTLRKSGALILYGPWLKADISTAPTNLAFDEELRRRNPQWGLRKVEDFQAEAQARGFALEQLRMMPANNIMLLFRLQHNS